MAARCDHVGVLVRDLEAARERLQGLGLAEGKIGEYPGEGTRELYLGSPAAPGRLLLLQPLGGDGPYARALAKRGPGLHHVALAIADPGEWTQDQPGWLVHPFSLQSLPECAWLCRPGVGVLLELVAEAAGEDDETDPATVTQVEVAGDAAALVARLDVTGTRLVAASGASTLVIGERRFDAAELGA